MTFIRRAAILILLVCLIALGAIQAIPLVRHNAARPLPVHSPITQVTASGPTVDIDVLWAYTPQTLHHFGSRQKIMDLTLRDLAQDNAMLAESGTRVQLRFVGLVETRSNGNGLLNDDLNAFQDSSSAQFADLRAARDRTGADLVQVFSETHDTAECGRGNIITTPDRNRGYSELNDTCADNALTSMHEIGHNFGLDHDAYVVPGASGPGHGYVDLISHAQTIMAYPTDCTDHQQRCATVYRFSNPRITYLGRPLGIPGRADSVSVIDKNAPATANYRTSSVTTVVTASPAFGSGGASVTTPISLTLSGLSSPVQATLQDDVGHAIETTMQARGDILTLIPRAPLKRETTYRVKVEGTTTPMSWTFSTGPSPSLTKIARRHDGLELTFNHPVVWGFAAPLVIDLATHTTPDVSYVANTLPHFTVLDLRISLIPGHRYRVVVPEGMADPNGNPVASTFDDITTDR